MAKKVGWFDATEFEKEFIKDNSPDLDITFFEEPLNEDTAEKAEEFDAVTIFIDSKVSSNVLEKIDVDGVACRSTGFDHVDLDYASENGVTVYNVPDYSSNTVAEHTFALLLAVSRKIFEAINKVREEGEFDHSGLRGFDLKGKTLGVIGTGAIGKHAIRMANGFQMHVVAYDPFPDHDAANDLGFEYVGMDELLERSDIVSLHCPFNEHTKHIISEEEISKMDETVIINTSRGGLVETDALLEGLDNGSVLAAGLDVLEGEGYLSDDIHYLGKVDNQDDLKILLKDHMLMKRDDVVITPHNAFNSEEALERLVRTTLDNLLEGSNPVN